MKKIKIAMICFALLLGITGAVLAKTNEKKRQLATIAYFRNAADNAWVSITVSVAAWRVLGGSCAQASITVCSGSTVPIYATQSTSNPAEFVQP